VQNTTIGAVGLTFQSISDDLVGSGIGIDLADTGSSGGLTVTGTGTAWSGGTIWTTSEAAGIQLTSTYAPSFTDMDDDDGIDGPRVNGLTLNGSTVSGANGLDCSPNGTGSPDGLTGTVSITNSTIAAARSSATPAERFTWRPPAPPSRRTSTRTAPDAAVSVTGSRFTNGGAFQFATDPASTGTDSVTYSNNTFRSTYPGHRAAAAS
jgi:hypothetical protein